MNDATFYSVDYLNRLLASVSAFEQAFNAWMETQHESDHVQSRGLMPTVWVRDGVDDAEVRLRELEVSETAGAASRAVAVTGAYMAVEGIGTVDPISNWSGMRNPKAFLSPQDIRFSVGTVKGRLHSMVADAEASGASDGPVVSPANLHPVVWSAAAAQWTIHQYRVAVREAAEALTNHWKDRLGRHDMEKTAFWQETLSPG